MAKAVLHQQGGSWFCVLFLGSGLDKISQSIVKCGNSCYNPFSTVREDVDQKTNQQHLQTIRSSLQSEAEAQYCHSKEDACQDVEDDSGEADDKQSEPLNESYDQHERECHDF